MGQRLAAARPHSHFQATLARETPWLARLALELAVPALKDHVHTDLIETLARIMGAAWPGFPVPSFLADASRGLDGLELKGRVSQVAAALGRALPREPGQVVEILEQAMASPDLRGWAAWPCAELVGMIAPPAPDVVIPFMAKLTARASCEFAIRPCIEEHPGVTFAYLEEWTAHPDEHVRRLVSEGTRPRLPWASRLKALQADPTPSIRLLDRLRDDPSEYVRRSVANHLGDIAKDHTGLALATAARWKGEGEGGRHVDEVVRHGLRALIKAGDPEALGLVGYDAGAAVSLTHLAVDPARMAIGGQATMAVELVADGTAPVPVVVEYRIHFQGARGPRKPKAFRMAERTLEPGTPLRITRRHTFDHASIRTLHPGSHQVDIQVNGQLLGSCTLELVDA